MLTIHLLMSPSKRKQEQNELEILYYYVFLDQQAKNKRKIRQIETPYSRQIH